MESESSALPLDLLGLMEGGEESLGQGLDGGEVYPMSLLDFIPRRLIDDSLLGLTPRPPGPSDKVLGESDPSGGLSRPMTAVDEETSSTLGEGGCLTDLPPSLTSEPEAVEEPLDDEDHPGSAPAQAACEEALISTKAIPVGESFIFRLTVRGEYRGSYPSQAEAMRAANSILSGSRQAAGVVESSDVGLASVTPSEGSPPTAQAVADNSGVLGFREILAHRCGGNEDSCSFRVLLSGAGEDQAEWVSYERLKDSTLLSEYLRLHPSISQELSNNCLPDVEFVSTLASDSSASVVGDTLKDKKSAMRTRSKGRRLGLIAPTEVPSHPGRTSKKLKRKSERLVDRSTKIRTTRKTENTDNGVHIDAGKINEIKRRKLEIEKLLILKELEILQMELT